jgi:hypothetical protein
LHEFTVDFEVMSKAEQETANSRTIYFRLWPSKSSFCLQPSAEGESQAPDTSSIMNEEFWSRAGSDLPKDYLRFMSSLIPITLWRPWQEQFLPQC